MINQNVDEVSEIVMVQHHQIIKNPNRLIIDNHQQ
jgi:hypothetical protein